MAIFLTSHYHGLLLNSLGFLGSITLFLILGVHGLAINPLLSLLSLLWACRGPFSLFHIIYCPWFTFSLFSGSFKPIYLFKTHLFISWACDSLILSLGLNGFFIRLLTPFCPCCWASPFHLGFQNGHQQCITEHVLLNPSNPKSEPISHFFPEAQTSHQSPIRYIHIPLSLSPKPNQISPYVCVYIQNRSPLWGGGWFQREQIFKTKNVQNTILDLVSAFPSEWNISVPTNFIVLFWHYY